MNRITFLPVALLFFSAAVVKSQAPAADGLVSQLQGMISANKALIDSQQKTLDTLDKLDQDAQQLKIFGKRG